MAKLNAPLFSFKASGAIANALVYFGWKGLNVVRSYVVPANPRTSGQTTQRGYVTACVVMIHYCQGLAANPLAEADTVAYALLGSLEATPRTWFNTIVKQWLDQRVAGKHPSVYHGQGAVGGSTKITVTAQASSDEVSISDGALFYGTSKSALVNSIACTFGELNAGKDITGLTAGVKYFAQYRPDTPVNQVGSNSGIVYAVATA